MRRFCAPALIILVVTSSTSAQEGQWQLAGGGAAASAGAANSLLVGPELSLGYGLTEVIRPVVRGGAWFGADTTRTGVLVGTELRLDVLEWIPFVEVAAGGTHWSGATELKPWEFTVQGRVGVEYLLDRSWSLAGAGLYEGYAGDVPRTLGASASWGGTLELRSHFDW